MNNGLMKIISSWWGFAFLAITISGSYVFFMSDSNSFDSWAYFLFQNPAGMSLYILMMLNLLFISIRIVLKRFERIPVTAEYIEGMDTYIRVGQTDESSFEKVKENIKSAGGHIKTDKNSITSIEGMLSFIPGTVLRIGAIMFLLSIMFSSHLRKTTEVIVNEGSTVKIFEHEIIIDKILLELPPDFLQIGEGSEFQIENISLDLKSGGKKYSVKNSFAEAIGGIYYKISHVGYAQEISFKSLNTELAKTFELDLLPPGKSMEFSLGDMAFTISLEPSKTIEKGLLSGYEYNLKEPLYRITSKKPLFDDEKGIVIKHGGLFKGNKYILNLRNHGIYVKLLAVHDPALVFIHIGLLISFLGAMLMFSRFFWYEKMTTALFTGNEILIGFKEEFFAKWGIMRFHRHSGRLLRGPEPGINKGQPSG